jgi:hypothetical protein
MPYPYGFHTVFIGTRHASSDKMQRLYSLITRHSFLITRSMH